MFRHDSILIFGFNSPEWSIASVRKKQHAHNFAVVIFRKTTHRTLPVISIASFTTVTSYSFCSSTSFRSRLFPLGTGALYRGAPARDAANKMMWKRRRKTAVVTLILCLRNSTPHHTPPDGDDSVRRANLRHLSLRHC